MAVPISSLQRFWEGFKREGNCVQDRFYTFAQTIPGNKRWRTLKLKMGKQCAEGGGWSLKKKKKEWEAEASGGGEDWTLKGIRRKCNNCWTADAVSSSLLQPKRWIRYTETSYDQSTLSRAVSVHFNRSEFSWNGKVFLDRCIHPVTNRNERSEKGLAQ